MTPPLRYNGNVNHAAFNPEGDRLITASDDGTSRLWTVACRNRAVVVDEAAVFRRDADRALRVAVADSEPPTVAPTERTSPDGRLVVKIGDPYTARVYDAATGLPVTPPLRHHNDITYVAFSPDGRRVVTTSADQTARVWDAATGAPVSPPLTHASSVGFADFSADGLRLVTASEDNSARVWDIATGELLLPPLKHDGTVTQAVFSANGERVASASLDQTARVWDADTGQALTPPLQHPWPVRQVRFSADGQRLLVTGSSGAVWSWDLPYSEGVTGELVRLAQLLSGNRLDVHRGIMPLKPRELRQTWELLRQTREDFFRFTADDATAWHRQAGEECIRGQHWEAALWHLEHLIQVDPDAWLPRARRGLVRAELGRWPDAQADFAEVVRRAPAEGEAWCLYALLCVQTRDLAGYRRACAALLDRSKQDDTARTAYLTAWACVLSEESGVKGGQMIELAERAVSSQPRDTDYLRTLGAALFRAGELDEAVRRLNEVLKLRGRRPSRREWLWLALVHARMGRTKEARSWLVKATSARTGLSNPSPLPWVMRLKLNLLQREAEQLLKSEKSNSK